MKVKFSQTSITGEIPKDHPKEAILADALNDWACCYMETPPINFGKGMVEVGKALGILPIEQKLMEYFDTLPERKQFIDSNTPS